MPSLADAVTTKLRSFVNTILAVFSFERLIIANLAGLTDHEYDKEETVELAVKVDCRPVQANVLLGTIANVKVWAENFAETKHANTAIMKPL